MTPRKKNRGFYQALKLQRKTMRKKDLGQAAIEDCSPAKGTRRQVTLSARTAALCRGLDIVLIHHGTNLELRSMLYEQIHENLDTSGDEENWLKRAKYLLTFPHAQYLRNKLPPQPDIPFEPKGDVRKWMRTYLHKFCRKNTHLWYSWLQVKRASLPASDSIVNSTYEKHQKALTSPDPGDKRIIKKIMENPIFDKLLERISVQVGHTYKEDFVDFTPSGSACWESTRFCGGQFGALQEYAGLVDDEIFPSIERYIPTTELVSMVWFPKLHDRDGARGPTTLERRQVVGSEEWATLRQLSFEKLCSDAIKADGTSESLKCIIQGILEPMKVRVISKGPALEYYSMKPLQVAMHTVLRSMPCFRLIGRPFCPTDFLDLKKKANPDDKWFSIDYSAATDGLSWNYSSKILRRVISKLDPFVSMRAFQVLGPHKLFYPDQEGSICLGDIKYGGLQTNGQLMGSILSFPILCLANLGVYLLVTSNEQKDWTDEERLNHVLVNGDDMVYSCHPDLWECHEFVARKVGLELSVGKAYIHDTYANVNSVSVHCDLKKKEDSPYQVDYLNAGLFLGQHKVQQRASNMKKHDDDPYRNTRWERTSLKEYKLTKLLDASGLDKKYQDQNLISCVNWILQGALPGKKAQLLRSYINHHSQGLYNECAAVLKIGSKETIFQRNLFLPIGLGGCGIEKPVGFRHYITKVQKNVAKSQILSYGLPKSSQRPLPGFEVELFEPQIQVPWSRTVVQPEVYTKRTEVPGGCRLDLISFNNIPYSTNRSTYVL